MTHQVKTILAFAAIYIIWGSSFFGVLMALKSFPPFLMSTLRFFLAGTILLVICTLKKEPFPDIEDVKRNMFYGVAIFIGGVVSVAWAQQFISSSFASIIITTPFWFVVLDRRQWGFYFSNKWIITGLLLGLFGVILLMGNKTGKTGSSDEKTQIMSILMMISGSFLWVISSLRLKYKPLKSSSYVNTCIQLLTAGLFCMFISFFRQEPQNLSFNTVRLDAVLAVIYLAIFSSLIGFMAFMWLIKEKPPAIVSTYSYVNPVVAVLLGWGFAGESISILQIFALFVILLGVFLVNVPKYSLKV
jgi:drug/metabolite transporter (DMT)-like permease